MCTQEQSLGIDILNLYQEHPSNRSWNKKIRLFFDIVPGVETAWERFSRNISIINIVYSYSIKP